MEPDKPEPKQAPPPNPFYEWVDVCSLSSGRAQLTVSAPGGKIAPQDAEDVVAWLELILQRMRRRADKHEPTLSQWTGQ